MRELSSRAVVGRKHEERQKERERERERRQRRVAA